MTYPMEALGWTLVHFCWQAAVIALVYRAADLLLVNARSNVCYVVSLAALLSMFAASVITLGYEEVRLGQDRASSHSSDISLAGMQRSAESLAVVRLGSLSAPGSNADLQARMSLYLSRAMPWLDVLWLVGVLALSVRTAGGWWLMQRLRYTGMARVPESVRESLTRLSLRIGIRRQVGLLVCERISSPLAMGIMRSLIVLPVAALTSLSAEQLEVVLAHELAHIRRADYLWNMLQTMIETLFFFHPAVWWVSGNLRHQRELCCDDVALACCSDPLVYATALLRLEEQRGSRLHLAMALDGHESGSGLRTRIARILGEEAHGRREIAPVTVVGVCAVVGLALLPLPHVFAGLHPMAEKSTMMQDAAVASAASPTAKVYAVVSSQVRPQVTIKTATKVATAAAAVTVETSVKSPVTMQLMLAQAAATTTEARSGKTAGKSDYIDQMRAAGYDVDLDKYIGMKIQGVTPEYARSMAAIGMGKPTADDLIAMKIHGVEPGTVAALRSSGLEANSFQDLIEYKIFNVSPEFIAGMKSAGFNSIPSKKLVELRIHGITPEFAKATKQQFPDVTVDQLVQLRIFHIDEAFIASAKQHGFTNLTIEKLVKLRISGLMDDNEERSEKR